MPARKLSSNIQGLSAVFITVVCILSASLGALFAIQSPSWQNVGLIPGFLFVGAQAWFFARLKRVVAFDDALKVSDLIRSELISFQNISRIRVYDACNVALFTLILGTPGRFGLKSSLPYQHALCLRSRPA